VTEDESMTEDEWADYFRGLPKNRLVELHSPRPGQCAAVVVKWQVRPSKKHPEGGWRAHMYIRRDSDQAGHYSKEQFNTIVRGLRASGRTFTVSGPNVA
jgi:hypothetical protein